ncbi:hypothetical protein JH06_5720 [Blastocystis sp. subtype 4]|uniref:hypothetical protein n=1 Tax=Blastocystis sp. subtype 4 TaxID=944170 RepID=UPI000711C633|nr:hypothetical protein JH06_5720 [Blastocystis sp. subtype 4]KNB42735.1 hypothetical protein JH06_5720 [Blastocystis sp. subtype 4]|eukprot:XP_014526178.1 hypothetical protein JH06_5720 [Blastocystis sp. subtype 4]
MKYYQLQKNLRKTMRILLDDGRSKTLLSNLVFRFFVEYDIRKCNSELTHPIGRLIISDCTIKQYQPCPCA